MRACVLTVALEVRKNKRLSQTARTLSTCRYFLRGAQVAQMETHVYVHVQVRKYV